MEFFGQYVFSHKEVGFIYFLLAVMYAYLVKKYAHKRAGYYARLGGGLIILSVILQTFTMLYSVDPERGSELLYPSLLHGLGMGMFVFVGLFFGLKFNVHEVSTKPVKVAAKKVAPKSHKRKK